MRWRCLIDMGFWGGGAGREVKRVRRAAVYTGALLASCYLFGALEDWVGIGEKESVGLQMSSRILTRGHVLGEYEMTCVKQAMAGRDVNAADRCAGIKRCIAEGKLSDSEDFVGYLEMHFCQIEGESWISIPLFSLFLGFLIYLMIWIADDYLSPSLAGIADVLQLSPEVAGVTFLALGNGAPDISSTFASVQSKTFSIAASELIGSAMFITTVVVASVGLVSHAALDRRSFLHNAIFLLGAVVALTAVIYRGQIRLFEAGFFILYYCAYLFLVLYMESNGKGKISSSKQWNAEDADVEDSDGEEATIRSNDYLSSNVWVDVNYESVPLAESDDGDTPPPGLSVSDGEISGEESGLGSSLNDLLRSATELLRSTRELLVGFQQKFRVVFNFPQTPLQHILRFTVPPTVRPDDEWNPWAHFTFVMVPVALPLFMAAVLGWLHVELFFNFPLWSLIVIFGCVASTVLFFILPKDEAPDLGLAVYLLGFVACVFWLFVTAREVVRVLKAIGTLLRISYSILGMTVLAWGNSIGDVVSNSAIAKQGSPKTAVAACLSSPLFNLVFSLGAALTLQCIQEYPEPYKVKHMGAPFYNTVAFLCFGLIMTTVALSRNNYVVTRGYAKILLGLYATYGIVNIVVVSLHVKLPW
uniref:Sodium/calcium exchanger membrane region domain-containing protein n=1 Tax=Rhodosorus marinus TaxID=101924 RepID=A0A7S0G4X5_9RHOD|mmetsp:Transcript_314/g.344  ORF Transcript_314/g.344 Transcript_314/m.344 type:complete len:644 (+) Transcript_314:137-2068(+)